MRIASTDDLVGAGTNRAAMPAVIPAQGRGVGKGA